VSPIDLLGFHDEFWSRDPTETKTHVDFRQVASADGMAAT
jgi:hypothetical protein